MKKHVFICMGLILILFMPVLCLADEGVDYESIDYVNEPAVLVDYAGSMDINLEMGYEARIQSYSSDTGVFRTGGSKSTTFTMAELESLKGNGVSSVRINSDGSITLNYAHGPVQVSNAELSGGMIKPTPGSKAFVTADGMTFLVNSGSISLSEEGVRLSEGSDVFVDSNRDGVLDMSVKVKKDTLFMFDASNIPDKGNYVGVLGDTLSASGSGIEVSLFIDRSGNQLASISSLYVRQASEDFNPEIIVQELAQDGSRVSRMFFSKAGVTFYGGGRPKTLSYIESVYSKNGKEYTFKADKTDDKWSYELCITGGKCNFLGKDSATGIDILEEAAGEPDPEYLISDEEFNDENYMTSGEIQQIMDMHNSPLKDEYVTVDGKRMRVSEYIYQLGQEYHINPMLILVRLEVEKSLITQQTTSQSVDSRKNTATGCLTTRLGNVKGLQKQLWCAAYLHSEYRNRIENTGFSVSGWGPGVKKETVDEVTVTPSNSATASLYTYDPYAGAQQGGTSKFGGVYRFWTLWHMFNSDLDDIRQEETPAEAVATR